MEKTAAGLVAYARAQLGRPYWYGTFGNKATKSLLNDKTKQYPSHYQPKRMDKYKMQLGARVHDCVGLIKGYLWSKDANSSPKYNAAQDVNANGMLKRCKEQGKIGTLPEIPGVLVFMKGHVGIYVGKGKVIEARGFNYGVVETLLSERKWTSWGKCPWIQYPTDAKYYDACGAKDTSIVDALKAQGINSSLANRKKIAEANGIGGYIGTAKQNIQMLELMKKGKLKRI